MIVSTTPVLLSQFEDLTDPRMERTKRHLLIDMVAIALCAAICGAEGWADVERFGKQKREWFARFLELPNGIPSHDTFGRVFARLDTSELCACLQRWIRALNTAISDHGVRLDGKTLRHSFDTAAGKDALQLLNAWSSDLPLRRLDAREHAVCQRPPWPHHDDSNAHTADAGRRVSLGCGRHPGRQPCPGSGRHLEGGNRGLPSGGRDRQRVRRHDTCYCADVKRAGKQPTPGRLGRADRTP